MSLHGDNTFGGVGSGLASLANHCAGCVRLEALAPDVTFAAVDPVGDARRLRLVSGTSCFVATVNAAGSEPYALETTELRTRNERRFTDDGIMSIDDAAIAISEYVVGAEQLYGVSRATPCVAVGGAIYSAPPPPAPQPYVYVTAAEIGGSKVELRLSVQAHVSADWSVVATTNASSEKGPIARLPILVAHATGGFEGVSQGAYYYAESSDPIIELSDFSSPEVRLAPLPSVKGEQKRFGCDLIDFSWAQSSVATPPGDWAFSGKAGDLGIHFPQNQNDYQANEPGLGHGINVTKEGRTAHNFAGIRYVTKTATYVSLTTTQVAALAGAVSTQTSWHVPFIANDYEKTATWVSLVQGQWPLYRQQHGTAAPVDLFCSPWTGRGTATALNSVVTFSHQLSVSDAAGTDAYFVGMGLRQPPALPAPIGDFTVANALFANQPAGAYGVFAYPRILESTAPPHLPSNASDVVDAEQCAHISAGGIAGLAGDSGRVYMTSACSGQVVVDASFEEGYVADRESALPHGNRLKQRLADFNGCVRFTGESRHFTLPMNDGSDVESLIVTISIANPELAALAIDSPLTRSSFLSRNEYFNELLQFSPSGYVSARSLCGSFSLGKNSPAGNWMGCNRFSYVGQGTQEQVEIYGSGLSHAAVHGGSTDNAYTFTLSRTCVAPSRAGCFQQGSQAEPSEECKQYFKLIRGQPFWNVKRLQYRLPSSPGMASPIVESDLPQYVRDRVNLIEPDLALIFVGADWTFQQNSMAIHCVVSGNEDYAPSYVNAAALRAVGGFSNDTDNRRQFRAKPLPVFDISMTALCEAKCHRVHFDKREIRRNYVSTTVTSNGLSFEQFAPTYSGDRLSSESHDVDFGRSTFGVQRQLSVGCNESEAEQFYAGQEVTLYWRIPPVGSSLVQQLRGQDASLYPALAITVQRG